MYGESEMHIMKDCLFPFSISIALQKNSPYTDKYGLVSKRLCSYCVIRFSTKIRQLKEAGLIGHWVKKEMDKVARTADNGN